MAKPIPLRTSHPSMLRGRAAFTLTEVIVVVAILGILASLSLMALNYSRDSALKAECLNRLKQLSLAISNYSSDNDNRFPGFGLNSRSRWVHQVAPYLGHEADYEVDNFPLSWDAYTFADFHCPAKTIWQDPVATESNGLYGINPNVLRDPDTPLNSNITGLRRNRVHRPAATVLLADKVTGAPMVKTFAPYPNTADGAAANHRADRRPVNGPDGTSHYLFVDGHVEAFDEWIGDEAFVLD